MPRAPRPPSEFCWRPFHFWGMPPGGRGSGEPRFFEPRRGSSTCGPRLPKAPRVPRRPRRFVGTLGGSVGRLGSEIGLYVVSSFVAKRIFGDIILSPPGGGV